MIQMKKTLLHWRKCLLIEKSTYWKHLEIVGQIMRKDIHINIAHHVCLFVLFPGYIIFLNPERTDAEKNKTDYLQQGDQ